MLRYVLKRILMLIPVVLIVSLVVYTLLDMTPGDAMDAFDLEHLTASQIEDLRRQHNLHMPMIYRYGLYMVNLVQGDLGVSDVTGINVWNTFMSRLPNTLTLAFASIIFAAAIGIPLGIFASKRAGRISDTSVTALSIVGMSMPNFWLGLMLMLLFSQTLRWLPAGGYDHGIRSIILPMVTQGSTLLAIATRQTRSSMLEVLRADFMRTARAKGVPEKTVVRKHALGNAWIPIITQIGISLGVSLAGAAVVETVFAWPGVGRLVVESVLARDVTQTMGVVIMTSVLYVFIQLAVDLIYAMVDPRIKSQYMAGKKKKKPAAPARGIGAGLPAAEKAPQSESGIPVMAAAVETVASEKFEEVKLPNQGTLEAEIEREPETNVYYVDDKESVDEPVSTPTGASHARISADGVSAAKMFRKRSQLSDIWYRLRKNKSAVAGMIILGFILLTLVASLFISWGAVTTPNMRDRFASPGFPLLFGADLMGRNIFLRVIYGTRYSVAIGFGAVLVGGTIGVILGTISGYYSGKVDNVIMRFSDVISSIPGLLLGMVIMVMLGQSLRNLIIAVGVAVIANYLRVTRASVLTVRNSEFVEAAKAIGLPNYRIMFTQVLPNALAPIIVEVSIGLGMTIIVAASLSFLGFGIPIPAPEWGSLISEGRNYARNAPWIMTFPGLFLVLTALAVNLLGDGLRDSLDPKLKR